MSEAKKSKHKNSLHIGKTQLKLLEQLCNANGVSGDEGEVRKIVLEQLKSKEEPSQGKRKSNLVIDALGNILVKKPSSSQAELKVLVTSHMDEVGLMLTKDDNDGFFRFELVGNIDKRLLVGKAVTIGKDKVAGVIGAKPIHLCSEDDLKRALPLDELRIDVSADNKTKVKVGDRATFATTFQMFGSSISAKALDNRLGVVTLLELLKHDFPHLELTAAFTTQEEIGLRGASVVAYAARPDLALVIDCTPAYDLPHWEVDRGEVEETTRYNTRLGEGAAIYIADGATMYDPRLIKYFIRIAEEGNIPFQIRQAGSGGTDAGAIHLKHEGIPSITISIPARYTHSPRAVARVEDWQSVFLLLYYGLRGLNREILNEER